MRHFLTESELKKFASEYFPRTVKPLETSEEDWKIDRIYSILTKGGIQNRFGGYCIQVNEDDGMSWVAEKINAIFLNAYKDPKSPKINAHQLLPNFQNENEPSITALIGKSNLIQISKKYGFLSPTKTWNKSIGSLALIIVFGASFGLGMIAGWPLLMSLLGGTSSAFLLWLPLKLLSQKSTETTPFKASIFNEIISNDPASASLKGFISEVCSLLKRISLPRMVLIDNWGQQDRITQLIIEAYLRSYQSQDNELASRVPEFWIILEGTYGDRFSFYKNNQSNGPEAVFDKIEMLRLKPLTQAEKETLIQKLGLPLESARQKVIKRICRNDQLVNSFKNKLRTYRSKYPKQDKIDIIDFLHLISLTAYPINISFTPKEVVSLWKKGVTRSSILKYHFQMKDMPNEFKMFMLPDNEEWIEAIELLGMRSAAEWRVLPEFADAITEMEEELQLSDSKSGHLFWALYWNDRIFKSHPYQSGWFSKLSFHLLKSEAPNLRKYEPLSGSQDVPREVILDRVLEDYLFAVEGSLRTCLFDRVPKLLDEAYAMLLHIDKDSKEYSNQYNKLIIRCWETYILTFDVNVLYVISNLNETINLDDKPATGPFSHLDMVFYHTLPLNNIFQIQDRNRLYLLSSQREASYVELRDYMRLHSAWLLLTLSPLMLTSGHLLLNKTTWEAVEFLENCIPTILSRLQKKQQINLVDLMSLSNAVWCMGLRMDNTWHLPVDKKREFADDLQQEERYVNSSEYRRPDYIISNIEQIIDCIESLKLGKTKAPEQHLQNEFFLNALLSEIAANAMGALTMAYFTLNYVFKIKADLTERVNNSVKKINHLFNINFNELNSGDDMLKPDWHNKVVGFLEEVGLIWQRLELNQLFNQNAIRRTRLNMVYNVDENRLKKISHSSGLLQSHPTIDILANLAMADFRADSIEIKSAFFQRATQIVIDNHLSPGFINEMCLIILFENNHNKDDISEFVIRLSEKNKSGITPIREFLALCPDDILPKYFNKLQNCISRIKNKHALKELSDAFKDRFVVLNDDYIKDEINTMERYYEFYHDSREGKISRSAEQVVQEWADKKSSSWYAVVLERCLHLSKSKVIEDACNEIFSTLPSDGGGNLYLILALTYTRRLHDNRKDEQLVGPIAYMDARIDELKEIMTAELNRDIYTLLRYYGNGDKTFYENKEEFWDKTIEERESLMMNDALKTRSFFKVFLSIFERRLINKLPISGEWDSTPAQPKDTQVFKMPISEQFSGDMISIEYLKAGLWAFSDAGMHHPNIEQIKNTLNESAMIFLPVLLNIIDRLPGLPDYVRSITHGYAERIEFFTMPQLEDL